MELQLKLVRAFKVTGDNGMTNVVTFYEDELAARIHAETAGFYNCKGILEIVMVYTDGTYLYEIKNVGEWKQLN